jgi:hypothetical protein
MIKRVVLLKSDYQTNEKIITSLGQIGDPRAIPVLEELARASWTIYPQSLSHMKAVLFESLGSYPRESIEALLEIGQQSKNHRIWKACRKLLGRK